MLPENKIILIYYQFFIQFVVTTFSEASLKLTIKMEENDPG